MAEVHDRKFEVNECEVSAEEEFGG